MIEVLDRVRSRQAEIVALGLGVLTLVLLTGRLDRSYNYDESVNTATVIRSGSVWTALTGGDTFNNHPVFAVGQALWWSIGGVGEARQRVLPIGYGVAAVVILTWWVARRLGVLAAVCAGLVLALNPMFVEQARSVRGYSLATLCVVVGVITLIEYVRIDDGRLLAVHVVAVVVALGTHAFAGVPLGAAGLAAVAAQRRIDLRLFAAWAIAGAGTLLLYVPSFETLRNSVEVRGTRYTPWAARVTTLEVLGRDPVTAWGLGAVLAVAAAILLMRRDLRVPVVVLAGLVVGQFLLFWQIIQPFDLYPRFFLATVPLVAIAVAVAVRRVPSIALVVAVALLFTLGNVRAERVQVVPFRESAAVTRLVEDAGATTCAVGGSPMQTYVLPPRELPVPADPGVDVFGDCDVFFRIGAWGRPLVAPAREHFEWEGRVAGNFQVFSNLPLEQLGPDVRDVRAVRR